MRLIIRIILTALAVASICAGLRPEQDIASGLARTKRLLKKGDVRQARVAVDSIIDGDMLKYKTIAMVLYFDEKAARDPRVLRVFIEQAQGLADKERLCSKEWELFHSGNALLYEKLKQLNRAEVEYRKALALAPNNPELLNALGWFYADKDMKLDQALKLTKRAVDLSPDNAMIIDSLGWAYYKLGNYKKAASTLRRAVELAPDNEELRYHLGAAYTKSDHPLQARIELNKALLLKPSMSEPRKILFGDLRHR